MNKRQVHRITDETWTVLKSIFPAAIALRLDDGAELSDQSCAKCKAVTDEATWFHDWRERFVTVLPKRKIDGKRILRDTFARKERNRSVHLIPDGVCKRLQEVCKAAGSAKRQRDEIQKILKDLCFPGWRGDDKDIAGHLLGGRNDGDDCQEDKDDTEGSIKHHCDSLANRILRLWDPEKMLCHDHGLALGPASLWKVPDIEIDGEPVWTLPETVFIVPSDDYLSVVKCVVELYMYLFRPSGMDPLSSDPTITRDVTKQVFRCLSTKYHPSLSVGGNPHLARTDDQQEGLWCRVGSIDAFVGLCPARCAALNCNQWYAESHPGQKQKHQRTIPIEVDGTDDGHGGGDGDDDDVRIVSESTLISAAPPAQTRNDGTTARILQLDGSAKVETVLNDLFAFPLDPSSASAGGAPGAGVLRRSRRRKRQRTGVSPIQREEAMVITETTNIASLRLRIYEAWPEFQLDQQLSLVTSKFGDVVDISNDDKDAKDEREAGEGCHNVPYNLYDLSFEDKANFVFSGVDVPVPETAVVAVVWQTQPPSKGSRNEIPNIELMDALLEHLPTDKKSSKRSETRRRAVETGFSGTLLRSSFSPTTKVSNNNTSDMETENKKPVEEKTDGECNSNTDSPINSGVEIVVE